MTVKTDYLQQVFNLSEFARCVRLTLARAYEIMRITPFDAIAFTGTSGSAMAYILSAEMRVPLICIRKETENSHYARENGLLEGFVAAKRYLFLDDFISSGSTFRRVRQTISEKMPKAECVAALMYTSTRETRDVLLSEYSPAKTITIYSSESYEESQLPLQFYR